MKKRLLLSTVLSLAIAVPTLAANVPEGTKLSENQNYTFWMLDGS